MTVFVGHGAGVERDGLVVEEEARVEGGGVGGLCGG